MNKLTLIFIPLVMITLVVTGCSERNITPTISGTEESVTTTIPPTEESVIPTTPATPVTTSQVFSETVETPLEVPTIERTPASNIWMKSYGGNMDDLIFDIQLDENDGFLIVGGTSIVYDPVLQGDIYLLRTDVDGKTSMEATLTSKDHKIAVAISPTKDGGFLVSGTSYSEASGQDIFLMQLDSKFQEIWSKTIGSPLDEYGTAWPLEDGSYIIGGNIVDPKDFIADPSAAGYAGYEGRSNIYFTRVDGEGNEIWSRTFGGENNVIAVSSLMTQDGGFIILGTVLHYPELDDDIYMVKIDANGNEAWSRTWEAGNLTGKDIIQVSDGNYLIVGAYSPSGDADPALNDFLFLKVDPSGNEVWMSVVGDPDLLDEGYALVETPDGGYLAAGDLMVDLPSWAADILLVKIDESGQLEWKQTIETNTHTMITKILQHPDGGYLIAGSTVHGRNFDILLIKTDENGRMQE